MAEAYYEPTPATDGATMNPVPGAVFQVFEIADTTFATPLSLRVGSGNPTTSVTASDTLATLPGVYVTSPNYEHIWKSGTFEWRRDSIDGAKKAIEDAKLAASNSASDSDASAVSAASSAQAAQDAAALVDAPADQIMADTAANPATAFATQLSATIASESPDAVEAAAASPLTDLARLVEANTLIAIDKAERQSGLHVGAPRLAPVLPTVAVTGPGGSSPITTPTLLPYDTSSVTRRGVVPRLETQFSTTYQVNDINGTWTPPPWSIEFEFNGADIAIRYRSKTGSKLWAWVDGRPISAAPVQHGAGGGSLYYYRLTFPTAVKRRIKIFFVINADFGGIDIPAGTTVTPVAGLALKKIVWLGTSYVEGAAGVSDLNTFATTASAYLNLDPFLAGQGGTGFVNNGGNANKRVMGDSTRLNPITTAAPDYVLVLGSGNDDGLSGIQAAASSLFQAIKTALPAVKVIATSPPPLGANTSVQRIANRDAVEAAAVANTVPFIDMLDPMWITGSGRAGTPAYDGPADVLIASDGVHPTQAGHDFLARKTAEAMASLL